MANTQRFQPEEQLLWHTVEGGSGTRRMVTFEGYHQGSQSATVHFGHNAEGMPRRYTVPVRELLRPEAPSNIRIWHAEAIKPPTPPKAPTESQLSDRLAAARASLEGAHQTVAAAREATAYAKKLLDRARGEHEAARAKLLELEAATASAAKTYEAWVRADDGTAPPVSEPNGLDRGAIVTQVTLTDSVVSKLKSEYQESERRLSEAGGGVRREALAVMAIMFDRAAVRLAEYEKECMTYRAELVRISQTWYGTVAEGPLRIAESSAALLTNFPDADAVKFMGNPAAAEPWKQMLTRLLNGESSADFTEQVTDTAQAAE